MAITLWLSGGATNSLPKLSLGGAKSSVGVPNRLFGPISATTFATGTVLYRCIYVSTDIAQTALSARILTETPSPGTTVAIGWGAAAIGGTETAVAIDTVAPSGVSFTSPRFTSTAISGGNFGTNTFRAFWIRITVTAGTAAGTEQFGLSFAEAGAVPVNLTIPTVSGTLVEAMPLTATTGTWSGAPNAYAYQWQDSVDGVGSWVNLTNATTYTLADPQVGRYLRVRVIASNAEYGAGVAAFSLSVGPILQGKPVNTAIPVVSGNYIGGSTLTTTTGTWTKTPTSYTYRWQESTGGNIWTNIVSLATSATFALTTNQVGKYVRSSVIGINASGSGTVAYSTSALVAAQTAVVATIVPRTSAIPATYFGLDFGKPNDHTWPSIGFSGLRLWGSSGADADKGGAVGGIAWSDIHRSAGVYHWQLFDSFMTKLTTNNQIGMYTFGYSPDWLTGGVDGITPAVGTAELDLWAAFVTQIVTRAAGKIKVWGLWNEPNEATYYSGTAAQLAAMAQRAFPVIKAADSTAIVLSPEIKGNGSAWLSDYLTAGGGPYFDACGVHLYSYPDDRAAASGGVIPQVAAYRSVLNAAGHSTKPIWNSEFSSLVVYDTSHVDFIGKAYPLLWSLGVDRNNWYQWDNATAANGQMWPPPSGPINAAGTAHEQVRDWLMGAVMSGQAVIAGSVYYINITRTGGYLGRIVWHAAGSSSYTITAGAWTHYRDLTGAQTSIGSSDTTVPITNSAIILETSGVTPYNYLTDVGDRLTDVADLLTD